MSVCLQNLAGIKYATAKYGEARDLYEQVLGLKKRTYGEKQGGDSIGLFPDQELATSSVSKLDQEAI